MSDITLSKAVRTNLLSLQSTADMMAKTQERLATGNKVNSALDNPTNFFTASSLNSRAGDLNALMDSMSNGIKTLEAADNGMTSITKTLESMQSTLRQARQDKSFQTGLYEVGANSVLTVDGGQFELPQDIKLGTQTPGIKAELKTVANAAFNGPTVSTTASETGVGARTLISTAGSGLVDGAVIKVAGMDITLADTNADTNIDATELATQVNTQLNALSSAQRNKYTVNLGAVGSPNEGKVIIEAVNPSAAPATVELTSGATEAVKATTSFNYAAITSAVSVDGAPVATGTTFEQFVANLKAGEEDGDYVVTADAATKNITLTAKAHGAAAPVVVGVPANVPLNAGTASTSTFQLSQTSGVNNTTQALSFAGVTGTVSLTSGMNKAAVEAAFAANLDLNSKYTVAIDNTLNVTLTEKVPSGVQGPAVTSTKGAAATAASSVTGSGGSVDFTSTTNNSALAGVSIKVDLPGGTATAFNFNGTADVDDQVTALQTHVGSGYTVTGTNGGLTITRADGKAFQVQITGGTNVFGLGGGVTSVGSTGGTEVGIVNGQTAGVNRTTGTAYVAAVNGQTSAPASAGVYMESVEAETNNFTVTYDGKTSEIAIGGIKGGIGSTTNAIDVKNWQDATIARVNAQLKADGITGLEATFDVDGKFSIVAKTPEAKSITISGDDGVALFGTSNVSTGTPTVDGYSSTSPVDKFVEEINRSFAGKLRASNDNGKLRLENLSTKELDVSFDADGPGVGGSVGSKIAGNSVRENLADQFNELRDQLDKLADDASFNGINLLRGDNLKITFNESGNSFIDIQTPEGEGINSSALSLQNLLGIDLDTDASIDTLLADVKLALSSVRSQASKFGSNLSIVQNRQEFTKQMINTLETGAANLTLADMNEEAANLLALQTRQSLSSSSLSLASQADQSVLQLLQ